MHSFFSLAPLGKEAYVSFEKAENGTSRMAFAGMWNILGLFSWFHDNGALVREMKKPDSGLSKDDKGALTMYFVGDIMLDRGVEASAKKYLGGDFSRFFASTTFLSSGDILFGNLEGPVSDKGKDIGNLYSFRMSPPDVIPVLKNAGFDVVSFANNHVGDWGMPAFLDTMARLKGAGIAFAGAGVSKAQAEQPVIIEQKGMKVGFLAFSDVGPKWIAATKSLPGILLASDPRLKEIVAHAAKQVDLLVVSFHFGDEYKTEANARQKKLAHEAIDAGARLVIGHHPHVVEGMEEYKNSVIAYSLGNFIFDQYFSKETMRGLALKVKVDADGDITYEKIPLVQDSHFVPATAN
jgi:poly-gamma-glutamate synthesis protein (capsule biosynthesis protein)